MAFMYLFKTLNLLLLKVSLWLGIRKTNFWDQGSLANHLDFADKKAYQFHYFLVKIAMLIPPNISMDAITKRRDIISDKKSTPPMAAITGTINCTMEA